MREHQIAGKRHIYYILPYTILYHLKLPTSSFFFENLILSLVFQVIVLFNAAMNNLIIIVSWLLIFGFQTQAA